MKNLLLLIADIAMTKGGSYRWIAEFILGKIRRLSMIFIISFLGLILISSALEMIMIDLQRTSERQQQLAFSSVSAVGLGIIIFSITAICLFFRKSFWGMTVKTDKVVAEIPQHNQTAPALELSPLMQALSVLIIDFVEERREKRLQKAESSEQIQAP